MPYNDPPTDAELSVGKGIRASHLRQIRDFGRAYLPDCVDTTETDPTKVLRPDGSGGAQWTDGGGLYTDGGGTTYSAATQSSAVTVIALPTGKYHGHLVVDSVDSGGSSLYAKAVIPCIIDTVGQKFIFVASEGRVTQFNTGSKTTTLSGYGTVTLNPTTTGVDATWTGNSQYLRFFFAGMRTV
jgi:hypothetical protein